jgi:hypothetical protein
MLRTIDLQAVCNLAYTFPRVVIAIVCNLWTVRFQQKLVAARTRGREKVFYSPLQAGVFWQCHYAVSSTKTFGICIVFHFSLIFSLYVSTALVLLFSAAPCDGVGESILCYSLISGAHKSAAASK